MHKSLLAPLALMVFCALHAQAAPTVLDKLEASVNASLILLSDIRDFRRTVELRAQLDPLFNGTVVAKKGAQASDDEIVEYVIDEKLISQAFPVTDAEVEQEINQIQSNNHIDRPSLRRALAEQGFAFEDYFDLIRASLSKRNLIDRDIRTKVTVSDEDVKNYFFNHYNRQGGLPSAFHLKAITISTSAYKSAAAAKEVASRASKALKAGESFDEVAKRFGEGGGADLGVMSEDQMSPLIRENVKKLKVGAFTDIFGGPSVGAYYIIKLADVKTSDTDRFEKAKDEIRNQLVATEYQHQISLWLDRQRQNAFVRKAGEAATAGLPASKS